MNDFKEFTEEGLHLEEGVNDPSIFKAVFMAGGPGSGKSFVASKSAFGALGLKSINSDTEFEFSMKRAGLDIEKDVGTPQGQEIRGKAKKRSDIKKFRSLKGRLGLAIDGTGHDFKKIKKQKRELEKLGYETAMVFVNNTLENSLSGNASRPRKVPEDIVKARWEHVQGNLGAFQQLFGNDMYIIDNNRGKDDININSTNLYKKISKWAKQPPKSRNAKKWIAQNT